MTTWIDACRPFAARWGIDDEFLEALDAFGHPHPRGGPPRPSEFRFEGSFAQLERELLAQGASQVDVAADLGGEVDAGQAETFARRLDAVDRILEHFDDPTGRLLRVGLRQRLLGILGGSRPRALRVRALADFYYSYAGRHHHRRRQHGAPSWTAALADATWTQEAAGAQRATLDGEFAEGPVHINLIRLAPGSAEVFADDCRAQAAAGVPFTDVVDATGAWAAVSGGFFLYSETDIVSPEARYDPVGLLMRPGEVLNPPVFARGGLVVTDDRQWHIGRLGPESSVLRTSNGASLALAPIVTRAQARIGPDVESIAVAGRVVVQTGRRLRVPTGGFVAPRPPGFSTAAGEPVTYDPPRLPDGRVVRSGIAGGPLLVARGRMAIDLPAEGFWGDAPPVTFSQDETGDRNLLPRLAAGIDGEGRLVLAAIDGRNFDRALGMSLRDVARLLIGLGCHTATNLDGGSSKRMVVRGQTLDLSSTEIDVGRDRGATAVSVRPVYSALFVRGPR